MYYTVLVGLLIGVCFSSAATDCNSLYRSYLSPNFNESIAHAIHSLTWNELLKFEESAPIVNGIPVVNPRLNDPDTTDRVVMNAPVESIGADFDGESMNTIDMILNQIGQPTDGLGPNWSPLERVVHKFHMKDLWAKLKPKYDDVKLLVEEMSNIEEVKSLCSCLTDVKSNGIYEAVDWVASHYKTGTPITLLNRPIPKLEDADSWAVWKVRLLHYYKGQALNDAAMYLYCVLN